MTDIAALIARLEAVLEGASPGPWEAQWTRLVRAPADGWIVATCDRRADQRYIAACDPDTIRALIASHKAQAARIAELEDMLNASLRETGRVRDAAFASQDRIAALEGALELLAKEIDARAKYAPGPDIDHWPLAGKLVETRLTWGDARRARALLTTEKTNAK